MNVENPQILINSIHVVGLGTATHLHWPHDAKEAKHASVEPFTREFLFQL